MTSFRSVSFILSTLERPGRFYKYAQDTGRTGFWCIMEWTGRTLGNTVHSFHKNEQVPTMFTVCIRKRAVNK